MNPLSLALDTQLEMLETAQLVRRADDPDLVYSFKHTLTQETAYQSILQKRRRRVHRLVAEAYEAGFPDRLPQYAAILAKHYSESGDHAKTLTYAHIAGDEAARVYADAEALSYYTLALEAARKVGADQAAPVLDLYLKRGRVIEVNNQFERALDNYQEMEAYGRAQSDQGMILAALIAQAALHSVPTALFDPGRGQELSDQALTLARDLRDRKAEAKILWSLMLLCYFTNRLPESVSYGEQSLAIARELDLREQMAFTLSDISRSYMGAGRPERALETQTEARALWRELGNLPLLADNLTNSAGVHFNRGEFEIAISLAEEALGTARSIGNLWGEGYAEQMLAVIHLDRGEIGKALLLMQHSLKLAEQIGALFSLPAANAFLSWTYSKLGEVSRAFDYAQIAVAKGEEQFPPFLPLAYAVQAFAYLLRGDLSEAESFIAKSHDNLDPRNFDFPQPFFVATVETDVALAKSEPKHALVIIDELVSNLREQGLRAMLAESLYTKSRVLLALGRIGEAHAVLSEARAIAESVGQNLILISILCTLSRIELNSGNATEGGALRHRARGIAQEIAAKLTPELRDLFLRLPDIIFVLEGE